jgi:glycerophosphoryl diester phosphodiesterase
MRRALAAPAAFFVALTLPGVSLFATPHQAAAGASCPTVVAHATGAHVAPENTAVGITMSARSGAPMVEMDVRWSVTGYPVLMHDATVDRTTPGVGQVAQMGLGDLTKLPAQDYAPWRTDSRFAATKVPYAWDFVNASAQAGVDMLLDVKTTPDEFAGRKLIEYVDRFAYRRHLVYMASPASVTAMRQWFPDLTYAVIEYPPAGRVYTPEYLRSIGASIYAVPWPSVTAGLVAYLHGAGLKVFTWTSDSAALDVAANWAAAATAGVDAIVTNEPAAALAALACRGEQAR